MSDRDERLGHELRGLHVPEHGPAFFAVLAERLQQEPPARRRPGWQRPPMLLGFATAAVLLAVFAATTLFTSDGTAPFRPSPPQTRLISASEVRTRVSTALSSLRTLQGEVTIECAIPRGQCFPDAGGRTTLRWSFATTAAGDERITGIDHQEDVAFSAARREQRALLENEPRARVISNLPAGPPDFAARTSVLRRDVASVVRAFLNTSGEVPVTEVTEQGRPAWRLVTPVEPNKLAGPGNSGDRLEVVVDRETGFPLRVTESLAGRFLHEVRLSNLVVDAPVDPASFTIDFPAGLIPFRQDVGFQAVPLGQVAAVVGYQPLLPTPAGLPAGFELAEVTVATTAQPTGTEGGNPRSRNVVSVAYRRGFDRIVVTTRSTGTTPRCTPASTTTCWADPLASGEGFRDEPQPFTIAAGALAGSRAELVLSPRGVPHIWAMNDRLVVTVAGDASGEELRRIAESFAPAG